MKKISTLLSFLFFMVFFVKAQEVVPAESAEPVDDGNGPKIEFVELTHDFGEIPYRGNGTFDFEFMNTGNEPLIIQKPKASCSCTVPQWPQAPIAPGEKSAISVTYKNTHNPGYFQKSVTVPSNAINQPSVRLTIKGTILNEIAPVKEEAAGPVNH